METYKGFFHFEFILNVLVSFSWVIVIHMLWVYDHNKYFISFSARSDHLYISESEVRF